MKTKKTTTRAWLQAASWCMTLTGAATVLGQPAVTKPVRPGAGTTSAGVPTQPAAAPGARATAIDPAPVGASAPAAPTPVPAAAPGTAAPVVTATDPAASPQPPLAPAAPGSGDGMPMVAASPDVGVGAGSTAPVAAPRRYLVPQVVNGEPQEPPTPPRPPKRYYPIGLEFVVMPVWQTSRGFDLFSTEDIATRVGLIADLELGDLMDRTPLSLEVGWTTDGQRDSLFYGQFDTEYRGHNLHGGLKLQHRLLPFLAPHVRVTAGASTLEAKYGVTSGTTERQFETHDWVAFGTAGAGVTFTIPTRIAVQPGFVLEGGYLFSGSLPLRLEPKASEGALATSAPNLGTLDRSGPYLHFGAMLRY